MPRAELPRLPREPLLEACTRRGITINDLGTLHGLNTRRLYEPNGISWEMADKAAVALGLLPYELFGDAWWEVCWAYEATRNEEEQQRLERVRAQRLKSAAERTIERPGYFGGRREMDPRWDPRTIVVHCCASDGCPAHDRERMEEVA